MKKYIVSLLFLLSMGLFTACGEEDSTDDKMDINQVCISAIFPKKLAATRIETDNTHKLRCIIELWTQGAGSKLVYHGEAVAEPGAEIETLSVDFQVNDGTYNCLMWADYIDAAATAEEIMPDGSNIAFRYYADKYYYTTDLQNVTIRDINSIINNDACDAFFYCGELVKKEGAALQLDIALTRPITKVTLKEQNKKEFSLLQGLTASFNVPTAFNVSTGQVSTETTSIIHTHNTFDPSASSNSSLFSAYIFAGSETQKLGEINLALTTKRLPLQNIVVPSIIPLIRGQHVQVSGNMMGVSPDPDTQYEITYDINVTDWTESDQTITVTDVKPKVGDFFYKDGSYSSIYSKDADNPCIGVVFAIAHEDGKAAGDVPANYVVGSTPKLEKVRGWVVAAYDFRDGVNDNNLKPRKAGVVIPDGLKGDMNDIQGFQKTELLKTQTLSDYPIAEIIVNYQNTEGTKAPDNTSGWYWGAAKQYDILADEYAEANGGQLITSLTVRNSLQVLADNGVGELFPVSGNERRHWYSTATDSKNKGPLAGFACLGVNANDFGKLEDDWWAVTNSGNARAILTF